jgi:hypothetical protein
MAEEEAKRPLDQEGDEWLEMARAAIAESTEEAEELGVHPLKVYNDKEITLPDFNKDRSPHVKRELFGRYLEDRDTDTVHDCYMAMKECNVDAIVNATFYHFGPEVPENLTLHECVETE